MLDYSEYTSLVDVLEKTELDDSYKELMKKETKVLDTINNVIEQKKTTINRRGEFLHMSLTEIYTLMFLELPQLFKELNTVSSLDDVMKAIFKGHRIIYIGIFMVLGGVFLFFLDNTSGK